MICERRIQLKGCLLLMNKMLQPGLCIQTASVWLCPGIGKRLCSMIGCSRSLSSSSTPVYILFSPHLRTEQHDATRPHSEMFLTLKNKCMLFSSLVFLMSATFLFCLQKFLFTLLLFVFLLIMLTNNTYVPKQSSLPASPACLHVFLADINRFECDQAASVTF